MRGLCGCSWHMRVRPGSKVGWLSQEMGPVEGGCGVSRDMGCAGAAASGPPHACGSGLAA